MDSIADLESGRLAAEPEPQVTHPATTEVARLWAVHMQLRHGGTEGPTPRALMPLVDAWAASQGWTGPTATGVGKGLKLAGLCRAPGQRRGGCPLMLHRDDAARLWRLVREAWAPGVAPGDHVRQDARKPRRRGVLYSPRPRTKPAQPTWAEALAKLGGKARPLVDSTGRVWPSPAWVARSLGGNRVAVYNAVKALEPWLREAVVDSRVVANATAKGASWRGMLWRYLAPEECAMVPPEHRVGAVLPAFRWGLVCQQCGSGAHARGLDGG